MKTSWSDFGISCPSLSLFILCIWESTLGPVKKLAVNNNHFNSLDNRYLAHTSRLHQYTEGKNFFLWLTCFVSHRDFIRHNILNFVLKRRIVLHTDTHIGRAHSGIYRTYWHFVHVLVAFNQLWTICLVAFKTNRSNNK